MLWGPASLDARHPLGSEADEENIDRSLAAGGGCGSVGGWAQHAPQERQAGRLCALYPAVPMFTLAAMTIRMCVRAVKCSCEKAPLVCWHMAGPGYPAFAQDVRPWSRDFERPLLETLRDCVRRLSHAAEGEAWQHVLPADPALRVSALPVLLPYPCDPRLPVL
jgi:hypothetical protein